MVAENDALEKPERLTTRGDETTFDTWVFSGAFGGRPTRWLALSAQIASAIAMTNDIRDGAASKAETTRASRVRDELRRLYRRTWQAAGDAVMADQSGEVPS